MLAAWAIFLVVLFAQGSLLIRDEKWPEMAVFLVMWLVGVVYGTAVLLEALPTSPTEFIIRIMSGLVWWLGGN